MDGTELMNKKSWFVSLLLACLASALAGNASSQTVEYIHTDSLGSPVVVTDAAKNVIERSEYSPYGDLLNRADSDGPGFTGHVQDAVTGLSYMQQRFYDPQLGFFYSVDPVTANEQPMTNFCRYCYGRGNPYKFTDADGRQSAADRFGDRFKSDAEAGNMEAYEPLRIPALVVTGVMAAPVTWEVGMAAVLNPGPATAITEIAAGAAGVTGTAGMLQSTGGVVRQFEQAAPQNYFRVFSGDSTAGRWLTAVAPRSSAWAQEALSLPPGNKATMIQEVLVPAGTRLERSRAIPVPEWNRMRGGAEQFKLLDPIPPENFGPGTPLQ
ncbi:RHS repeat domain-containing protein [Pseudoxanthomonas winnipegensis]|uniref:RHS repeat domain-containing protein n=1 Tax=Pseudoxanthomonas winnipegensis TaxID=2480810 RepID=UPI003F85AC98